MPLPTLVIAGAQKCGTSSLSQLLRQHPQVFMSRPKELHYFDRHFDRGVGWYEQQFTPAPRHVHYGEATPTYIYDEDARTRMLTTLPEAKIILILRDPATRAYSHYWHVQRLGHEGLPFEAALEREGERISSGERRDRAWFSYVDRGHYIKQVQALESAHDKELLHVMLLEDLVADRVRSLRQLFRFLGVRTARAEAIKEQWTNRYRIRDSEAGKVKVAAYPPMPPEIRAQLVETFRPSNDQLAEWLGRDLSAWNTV